MTNRNIIKVLLIGLMGAFLLAVPSDINAQRKVKKKARRLATQGDKFYRQKNYQAAIDKYAEALVVQPVFPFARFSKGYSHFNLKQYEQSVTEFSIALNQGFRPLQVFGVRWQANFLLKKYDLALQDVKKAQSIAPNRPYYYIAEGQIFHEQKQYNQAINAYLKAVDLKVINADVYYYLAKSYNSVDDYLNQEKYSRIALSKGTKFASWSWFYIADSLQRQKKQTEAAKAFERVIAADKTFYGAYVNLAEIYRNQNNYQKAIKVTREGIIQYPNDSGLHVSLSWYYSLADRTAYAIEVAKRAIQLAPNQYMAHTNLCRAYNDSKQYRSAVKSCTTALELQPGDGETHFYLGRAYDFLKKPKTATGHYRKAVTGLISFTRDNPDYSDGFYLLGNAHYANNQRDKAIEAYKKCLDLSPRFAKARFNLGYIYMLKGNMTAAKEQQSLLKDIDPDLAKDLLERFSAK